MILFAHSRLEGLDSTESHMSQSGFLQLHATFRVVSEQINFFNNPTRHLSISPDQDTTQRSALVNKLVPALGFRVGP